MNITRQTRKAAILGLAATLFGSGVIAGQAVADQPYMHQALAQLMGARSSLASAADDKGGHRLAALRDIDAAVGEIHAGMNFARHY